MKKGLSLCVALALLLSVCPVIPTSAGMITYTTEELVCDGVLGDVFAPTVEKTATATFTAPGTGTVVLPASSLCATAGDGFLARVLKEGNVVSEITVNGGEEAIFPETELRVMTGDTITFEADTRAFDGDRLTWNATILYQGGVAQAEALVNFIDLNNHWAKSYVVPLAEEGIIKGKTPNSFDPDGQITRAEFLTLALKVANLPVEVYMPSYADVSEGQWFSKVAQTAKLGEIPAPEMIQDNNLRPDAPILREEMTAVIMRVIAVMRGTQVDATHSFNDAASFSAWANDYIGRAAKLGIVTGNPDGSFNAQGNATRGEAAVMFSRLKKFLDETPMYTPAGEYSTTYNAVVYEGVDLNKMINDAYAAGQKEITIAPGAYRLKATPKGGHIFLEGMEDFTINGYGVTILMQTKGTTGFALRDCKNVTINGFSTDHDERVLFQAQIYNIDPDGYYLDLTIEPGYPQDVPRFISTGMMGAIYDRDTGFIVNGTDTIMIEPKKLEKTGPNTYRLNQVKIANQPGIKVGDYLGAWAYNVSGSYGMRGCEKITLRDINIWSGMCVITDIDGVGDNHFYNVQTTCGPRPLGAVTKRVVAVHGDGLHTTANRIGPKMENSTFEHLLDDGTNIHGHYAKVYEVQGDKVILGVASNQQLYWPGDDLRFYNPTTEENSAVNVKSCELLPNYTPNVDLNQAVGATSYRPGKYFAVTLEKGDRNFKVGDWCINRDWTSSGYYFKNCTFQDSRSRALLIKSSDGLIENCNIGYGSSYGLWIAPEFDWLESGYSENVVIRNCNFYNSGWHYADSAGLTISGGKGKGQDHENIVVEGCTFYGNNRNDLWMSEGVNYTIRNNTFKNSSERNAPQTISLRNCTDVTVSGNQYETGRKTEVNKDGTVTNYKG